MKKLIAAILFPVVLLIVGQVEAGDRPMPTTCTYEMRVWNVNLKGSASVTKVEHQYGEFAPEEIDPATGCTVCSEDQVRIDIPPLPSFSVCNKTALRVRDALSHLLRNGAPIHTVIGYHVIKSRGPVDVSGNRTGFSNHSFGTAIDINPDQNGLYDNCLRFGSECRLLRGGKWRPGAPGALERNDDIVRTLKTAGLLWGGEIEGSQKDFMHFSLTGY